MALCTGKTFRIICSCLIAASEGKRVVYIAPSHRSLDNARLMAVAICQTALGCDFISVWPQKLQLKNGGEIIFETIATTNDKKLAGYRDIELKYDTPE